MNTLPVALLVAAAVLASCGERGSPEAAPPPPAASAVREAPVDEQPVPSRDPVPARAATQAPAPTARDSAEAAREDVSPEWKMNERKMGPYRDCMEQVRAAPPETRERLEEACGRLPSAPRRR